MICACFLQLDVMPELLINCHKEKQMIIVKTETQRHSVTLHLENGTIVVISSNANPNRLHMSFSFASEVTCEKTADNECEVAYKAREIQEI